MKNQMLSINQSIYCILYGGMNGYVKEIKGEQRPESIQTLGGGAMVMGGNAQIVVRFRDGHESTVPEAICKGVQWSAGEILTAEEVAEYDQAYTEAKRAKEEAAQTKAQADAKEISELPAKFPHLTPKKSNKYDDWKGAKKTVMDNIRTELKHHFPNIKFSVTNPHNSTVNIRWTDGATHDEVNRLMDKFEDHHSDETGDFSDYHPSNFNDVFGGMQYVFCNRDMSKEVEETLTPLIAEIFEKHKGENGQAFNCWDAGNLMYRLYCQNSIPAGAKVTGIEETGETCGLCDVNTFYRLTYSQYISKEAQDIIRPEWEKMQIFLSKGADGNGLQLVDYSPKAVAVFGDTKPIKDTLKGLGGRFNAYLTLNGEKVAGWIFPKTKEEAIRTALSL